MKNILLLEDDPAITHLLKFKLTREGYSVSNFSNGENAANYLIENKTDLVISDIMMPIINGIALLKEIKADKRISHIPVILLSAISQDELVEEGLKAGAAGYLTKPFSVEELLKTVKRLI